MEKKTNIVQFTTTPGKTVLERFKNYIKRNDTSEGMLEILSIEKNPKNMSDPHDIFAVKSDDSGNWIPVSKKELLFCHTKTPTGMIEPELNANYTEITKID